MKKSGNTKSEKKLVYGAIITFLLAVAVFSSIKLTKVDAMNGKEYAKYKYYTSYQVQPGDTLTAIAQEHIKDSNVSTSDYIDEVMKNNKLSDDKITSGYYCILFLREEIMYKEYQNRTLCSIKRKEWTLFRESILFYIIFYCISF